MNTQLLKYIIIGVGAIFVVIAIAYYLISQKMGKSEYKKMRKLQEGTKSSGFNTEILFQKLYVYFVRMPFIKKYTYKQRRKLEIINIDDEYAIRRDTAKNISGALLIIIPVMLVTIMLVKSNPIILFFCLMFEIFMIDSVLDAQVDKKDDTILKEQLDFFAEIRHAYHEFNMVEEAIYQTSQDDEKSISKQGERIYEILISDYPEIELEKYYDVAPNPYLKEFAGVSYLTREFGDRKIDGSSLYLKNLNNIGQEMQLEILKRDKLNYVFQSLTVISFVPVMLLTPLKAWAISNFNFTQQWYNGKPGLIVSILILILTVICYELVRRVKDNGSTDTSMKNIQNPWQNKVYKNPIAKVIVNAFMPKKGSKEDRKVTRLLQDSASHLKLEWLYVNRVVMGICGALVSFALIWYIHRFQVNYILTEPVVDYNQIGTIPEYEIQRGYELRDADNEIIEMFRGKLKFDQQDIKKAIEKNEYYKEKDENVKSAALTRIVDKLNTINNEYISWVEYIIAFVFAIIGYMFPLWLLYFQKIIRQLEMEDEVMQYQTIILMLMRIERVNVEMILEWLERYSNIFRGPISRCCNNYEAGAWEALEKMKEEVTYEPLLRIIESMQAAVEKIPIKEAFDELDSERDYYQEKRKETNERLIKRKGTIGKVIGFAPMVVMFCGYLIIPLVFVGITSMGSSMGSMAVM